MMVVVVVMAAVDVLTAVVSKASEPLGEGELVIVVVVDNDCCYVRLWMIEGDTDD